MLKMTSPIHTKPGARTKFFGIRQFTVCRFALLLCNPVLVHVLVLVFIFLRLLAFVLLSLIV